MRLDIYLVIRQCFDLPPPSVTTSQNRCKPALKWKCWPQNWKAALFFGNWNVTKKRISFLIWDPEKSSHLKIRKVFQTNFLFPSNKILLHFKVFQLMKWQLQFYQWLIWSNSNTWNSSISNHYISKFEFHLFNYSYLFIIWYIKCTEVALQHVRPWDCGNIA